MFTTCKINMQMRTLFTYKPLALPERNEKLLPLPGSAVFMGPDLNDGSVL